MTMEQDLFIPFQTHLSAIGGESYLVADLMQAAEVIATHLALAEKDIVIPPHFAEFIPWGAIVSMLRDQGIRIREAGSPGQCG